MKLDCGARDVEAGRRPSESWDLEYSCLRAKRASDAVYRYFLNAWRIFKNIANGVRPLKPGAEVIPGIVSIAVYGRTPRHIVKSGSGYKLEAVI